ncbi:hypothetical protein DRW41_00070 [Neobacillus piezotolerans]|uniref:DUF3139 domain-containing protein n=1 Tax=Neobacillus piezotolerans TaxID=2259171 RepID=A0A3D8GU66_9BACI|nr:hypothetical protein [Neobacillus piezotolerans]RDU38010.1 hypothetical protein DRW41_00070 [Neobacillus piezotolerans]
MEPKSVVELITSSVFVIVLFACVFLLPPRRRKVGMGTALFLTAAIIVFFAVRPFWYDFQYVKKKEVLNSYLESHYPGEEWYITRPTGRHENQNILKVTFNNETDWMYMYFVGKNNKICQTGWTPPEGKLPGDGDHYEKGPCK